MVNTILFSSDFPPKDGGVANYAFEVSKQLEKHTNLKSIITYNEKAEISDSRVIQSKLFAINRELGSKFGDKYAFFRTINTFSHFIFIFVRALLEWVKYSKQKDYIVAVSCYGYKQILQLTALSFVCRRYTLVLHGLDILTNSQQFPLLFHFTCKNASRIVLNSQATQNLLLSIYPKLTNKCLIQYPIVNVEDIKKITLLNRDELSEKYKVDLEHKTLFFTAARLIKRKGIDIAIRSITTLHKEYPDVLFFIAGKGEEYKTLQSLIIEFLAEDYIKLLGYITDQEKFSILNESEFFIMPTNSQGDKDFEGFGISFIEASLFKNVVIGGSHGGVSEAISDYNSGRIFDFDKMESEKHLNEFIKAMISDKEERSRLQQTGSEYVSDNFAKMDYSKFISDLS